MAATKQDIERWLQDAIEKGATHIISVSDTFDYDDYPVYVMPDDDLETIKSRYNGKEMQKINEVIVVPVKPTPPPSLIIREGNPNPTYIDPVTGMEVNKLDTVLKVIEKAFDDNIESESYVPIISSYITGKEHFMNELKEKLKKFM